jgi:pimeloyl-ACP methyl ester carboxylesterase
MLHGGSAYAHWWDLVAPALLLIFMLLRSINGAGDSQHAEPPAYGSRHYLEDLHAFIKTLGLHEPVLMGHSMGGHNSIIYDQHAQDLGALILVDTDAAYPERAVAFLRTLGEKPAKVFNSFAEAISRFQLLPRETFISVEKLRSLASFAFRELPDGKWTSKLDRRTLFRDPVDGRPFLSQISCPTLIVRAQHTPVLSLEKIERLISKLPNGRWIEVPDANHHVILDNPDVISKVVRQFLGEVLPS